MGQPLLFHVVACLSKLFIVVVQLGSLLLTELASLSTVFKLGGAPSTQRDIAHERFVLAAYEDTFVLIVL